MPKKLTKEEFIERAVNKHDDKYDYSLVEYKNTTTKVKIICPIHNEFMQTPDVHMKGHGCKECVRDYSKKNRLSTKDWISRAVKVHGDRYVYDKVNYTTINNEVTIYCKEHGYFKQVAKQHTIRKRGCPYCAGVGKLDRIMFIEKSKLIHGDKYNYSLVDYVNTETKVDIICNVKGHGVFKQTPHGHLGGKGCSKCQYDLVSDIGRQNPVGWTPTNWVNSAIRSNNFDSFKVYIIKCYNDSECFYKIGRTFTTTKKRFNNKNSMPYNYEAIKEFVFNKHEEFIDNAKECFCYESELKRINNINKYTPIIPFKGMYECFSKTDGLTLTL